MGDRHRGLHPFDAASLAWMLATSGRFDAADVPWLVGPAAGAVVVGHGWVEQAAVALGGA